LDLATRKLLVSSTRGFSEVVETKAQIKQVQGRVGVDAPKRVSVDPLLRNRGGKRVQAVFGFHFLNEKNYHISPNVYIKRDFKILF